MQFVALVSGGKDSCYNILHCIKNGHNLVGLANLYPVDESEQELDSYMFQTVGHNILSSYKECTGLPMLRQAIKRNGSVNVSLNYLPTENDEVEDLYRLLKRVKDEISDVEAVSVGAILSSYQRIRVESVCSRLGLVVLSYLWQRDQLDLMTEMCSMSKQPGDPDSSRMDARLIKVAAIGLNETHLLKSLPEMLPILKQLNSKYGVHICGEGGEFETIVLDAPFFTKGRLEIISTENSVDKGEVCSAKLITKVVPRILEKPLSSQLKMLPILHLGHEWTKMYQKLNDEFLTSNQNHASSFLEHHIQTRENIVGNMLYVNGLNSNNKYSIPEAARELFQELTSILKKYGLFKSQIFSTTLLLSNMENFAEFNKYYNDYFTLNGLEPLPPSRVCVESRILPNGVLFQLSLTVDLDACIFKRGCIDFNENKDGLHVQSRSYWCPCNIGPYSQATWNKKDPNRISYICGQIALVPETMEMYKPLSIKSNMKANAAYTEAIVSLRHFHTLKTTINSLTQLIMTCYISMDYMANVVSRVWSEYCDSISNDLEKCLVIVRISHLPRNALCEWGGITCSKLHVPPELDSSENDDTTATDQVECLPAFSLSSKDDFIKTTVVNPEITRNFITIFVDSDYKLFELLNSTVDCHVTLFYVVGRCNVPIFAHVDYIPVYEVYGSDGNIIRYALQIRY